MPKYLDLEGLKLYDKKLKEYINWDSAYQKPEDGIPFEDLEASVQQSLTKADTALQAETDPTVPAWAKEETKPTYTASEVGAVPTSTTVNGKSLSSNITLTASDVNALPASTVIPSKLSDLTNDAGFIISSDLADEVSQKDKPVTANAVYEYITELEKVIASALNDLNTRLNTYSDKELVISAALNDLNSNKQNKLVSGTNIKTINNQSLLGEGNITISGGGDESCCKRVVLTRAEYTTLANNNALDEDTLYVVLEAQTETITGTSEQYDLRTNTYNDLTIDILQPSSSGGGGTIVA